MVVFMKDFMPFRFNRRYLLIIFIFLLALYVLVPQLDQFNDSWRYLRRPDPGWLMAGIGLAALTYFFAALTYKLLAFNPLNYRRLVIVQLAAMFVNRLLPGGIGALGTNFVYLKSSRHSTPQAASVVAVNNLLGGLGHGTLLILAFFWSGLDWTGRFDLPGDSLIKIMLGIAAIAVVGILIGRRKFLNMLAQTARQLMSYRRRKARLGLAFISSCGLTLANVLALYCCAQALDISLGIDAIMLVFTLGISLGTAVPTPGGLGAFEAGLLAGFVAYNVDSSAALAAALLYRLITYWLAMVAGATALFYARRRSYI